MNLFSGFEFKNKQFIVPTYYEALQLSTNDIIAMLAKLNIFLSPYFDPKVDDYYWNNEKYLLEYLLLLQQYNFYYVKDRILKRYLLLAPFEYNMIVNLYNSGKEQFPEDRFRIKNKLGQVVYPKKKKKRLINLKIPSCLSNYC